MQGLTDETRRLIADLAGQYGISENAVLAMLVAVQRGHGTMAQFNIGELGGGGQWMMGGMTMVGDMFNHGLKYTVDGLCNALSQALASGRIELPREATGGGVWWPQELGAPSSTGAQNESAYAVFPAQRRLAIRDPHGVTLYDTGDHFISGVGHQQGSNAGLTFSSQYGSFSVSSLRRAGDPASSAGQPEAQMQGAEQAPLTPAYQSQQQQSGSQVFTPAVLTPTVATPAVTVDPAPEDQPEVAPRVEPTAASVDAAQIIGLIEKLAALREAGILTEAEFSTKKTELLARL